MKGRRHSQFRKILIGYDGSQQGEKATETARTGESLDSKCSSLRSQVLRSQQRWSN